MNQSSLLGAATDQPSNCQEDFKNDIPNNYQDSYDSDDDDLDSFEMIHDARVEDEESFKMKLMHYKSRWYALFLMVFVIFGCYFCYDNPSELEERI